MENNKICPLLSITSEDNLTDCYGESCAWYVPPVYASNGKLITKGRCAIFHYTHARGKNTTNNKTC